MTDAETFADAERRAMGRLIREQGASRGREVASGVRGARDAALDVAADSAAAAAAARAARRQRDGRRRRFRRGLFVRRKRRW